jgi:glycosyltransferase involved in cell wall biosynthesis
VAVTASAGRRVPLSVIMPVYNEQDAIAAAVDDIREWVLTRVPTAEVIVVNDGSRDRTGAILDETAAHDRRIRVIHQQNRGHGGALITGLEAATGEYVFLIDSDRQIPLNEFDAAWSEIEAGRDAVFGVRRRRCDPHVRLYLSSLIQQVVRVLFGARVADPNVPYKLFRRSLWQEARPLIPDDTLAPSLFLAIVARRRGRDIREIDVVHRERDTGEVAIRRMKLLKFCLRGLSQMLTLRRHVSS